jgi:spermidine synthase
MGQVQIVETPDVNSVGDPVYHFVIDDVIWMSSDEFEVSDALQALKTAKGDCYIAGLGLGMITWMAARLEDVKSITVVEIDSRVINVSSRMIQKMTSKKEFQKVRLVRGDALAFFKTEQRKYDWAYLDTYLEPDEEARKTILAFEKDFEAFLRPGGYIEAWYKDLIKEGFFEHGNSSE